MSQENHGKDDNIYGQALLTMQLDEPPLDKMLENLLTLSRPALISQLGNLAGDSVELSDLENLYERLRQHWVNIHNAEIETLLNASIDEPPMSELIQRYWSEEPGKLYGEFTNRYKYTIRHQKFQLVSDRARQAITIQVHAKVDDNDFRQRVQKIHKEIGMDAVLNHMRAEMPVFYSDFQLSELAERIINPDCDVRQVILPESLHGKPLPYRTILVKTPFSAEEAKEKSHHYRQHMHEQGINDDGYADLGKRYKLRTDIGNEDFHSAVSDIKYLTRCTTLEAINYVKEYIERATQPSTDDDNPERSRTPMNNYPPDMRHQ